MGSNPSLSANSMKSTTYLGSFQAFRGIFQGALIAIGKRKVWRALRRGPRETVGRLYVGLRVP